MMFMSVLHQGPGLVLMQDWQITIIRETLFVTEHEAICRSLHASFTGLMAFLIIVEKPLFPMAFSVRGGLL